MQQMTLLCLSQQKSTQTCGSRCFLLYPLSFFSFPSCLISITFPFLSPGLFPFLSQLFFFFSFGDPRPLCIFAKISVRVSPLLLLLRSVKYEDPQALGSLASALDVRQQNAGGVSALVHRHTRPTCTGSHRVTSRMRRVLRCVSHCDICPACSDNQTLVKQKKKKGAGRGLGLCAAKINMSQ